MRHTHLNFDHAQLHEGGVLELTSERGNHFRITCNDDGDDMLEAELIDGTLHTRTSPDVDRLISYAEELDIQVE